MPDRGILTSKNYLSREGSTGVREGECIDQKITKIDLRGGVCVGLGCGGGGGGGFGGGVGGVGGGCWGWGGWVVFVWAGWLFSY